MIHLRYVETHLRKQGSIKSHDNDNNNKNNNNNNNNSDNDNTTTRRVVAIGSHTHKIGM